MDDWSYGRLVKGPFGHRTIGHRTIGHRTIGHRTIGHMDDWS